jgi:fumarate hydratase class II
MAANFLQSARLLGDACMSLTNIVRKELNQIKHQRIGWQFIDVSNSFEYKIGYYKSAEIAQTAHKKRNYFKEEAVRLGYVTPEDFDAWVKPEDMVGSLK